MALQSATLGRFWLGAQTAKGSVSTQNSGNLYAFKANLVDVAPAQMVRNVGQLVGGSFLPGGSIKTAAWSGGAMVCPPPLESSIGWLLHAFAGTVSTTDNGDSTYTHAFPSAADDTAPAKYLTARRQIPAGTTLYEQMLDQVPYRLLFAFAPGEYATMRAEMIGRTFTSETAPGWTFANAEDEDSVPIACKGHFELPDATPVTTATGVSLELVNIIPPLQRVLTVGNYYPIDFPVLGRALTVSFSHLWEDKTLYESLYYSTGEWNPVQYSSSFELEVQSPGFITGALPYKLNFYGQTVDWSCQPLRLAGGDLVEMQMTGTVVDSSSGSDWYLALTNGASDYAWPT